MSYSCYISHIIYYSLRSVHVPFFLLKGRSTWLRSLRLVLVGGGPQRGAVVVGVPPGAGAGGRGRRPRPAAERRGAATALRPLGGQGGQGMPSGRGGVLTRFSSIFGRFEAKMAKI